MLECAEEEKKISEFKEAIKKKRKKALETLEMEAGDNPESQFQLGLLFYHGEPAAGVAIDRTLAMDLITSSAASGFVQAQIFLGNHYNDGRNRKLAMRWLEKAVNANVPEAQTRLAEMLTCHLFKEDLEVNVRAMELFTKAAEQGDVSAQMHLADYYSQGLVVEKNVEKAREWYEKAAQGGSEDAKSHLQSMALQQQKAKKAKK